MTQKGRLFLTWLEKGHLQFWMHQLEGKAWEPGPTADIQNFGLFEMVKRLTANQRVQEMLNGYFPFIGDRRQVRLVVPGL